ncbi:MAG TPA: STAS domain-containing protein [Aquihabitans sp.]|nr:STAS domain-containing protein [Aquihabitans sp.]
MAADAHVSIQIDRSSTPVLVTVAGEVDAEAAPELVEAIAGSGGSDLAFDLAGVTFIDSSGLRVIAGAAGEAEEAGRRCTVVAASPAVERIFAMTGLTSLIDG